LYGIQKSASNHLSFFGTGTPDRNSDPQQRRNIYAASGQRYYGSSPFGATEPRVHEGGFAPDLRSHEIEDGHRGYEQTANPGHGRSMGIKIRSVSDPNRLRLRARRGQRAGGRS